MASYASTVLGESSIAAYWKLNETSGTQATDSAPTPDHGTYVNAPTFSVAGPIATNTPGDTVVSLDRPSLEEITIPDAAKLDFTTGFTMEAWVKPATNPASGEFRTIFAKLSSGLVNGSYDFSYTNNAGTYQINVEMHNGTAASPTFNLAGALPTASWSHVAGTWDGSNVRAYLNGVIVGSPFAKSGNMTANTQNATIGRYGTGTDYWHGGIGHVAVYNQALTATQLLNHYTVGTTADSAGGQGGPYEFIWA